LSTESQPPIQRELGTQVDESGILLSQDGTWQWDGTRWVPRGADAAWLGDFIGFSKTDLDANRAGRLTYHQAAGLWLWAVIWSGLGLMLLGLAVVLTLPESFWVRVFVAPIVFTVAVYFCWRGFAAGLDATSGAVAVTSGTLSKRWESDDDAPWGGAGYYYVGVGGVEKKFYRSAGEKVPVGIYCRAYYAYGSRRLLSVEVAPSVDAFAFVPAAKTWARVRWSGIAAIVGVFGVLVGVAYVATGDPTRRIDTSLAGVILLVAGGVLLGASIWRLVAKRRHRSST
jgi:hypothetical protein